MQDLQVDGGARDLRASSIQSRAEADEQIVEKAFVLGFAD